jgi:RNA recognition motif-containing protein
MTNIYVGNLSYDATEEDLREAFSEYGEVSDVNIIKDRETGRPRGFAFVEMPDGKEAASAIEELNLARICNRSITVNEARPKTDRRRRGGGGRRNW